MSSDYYGHIAGEIADSDGNPDPEPPAAQCDPAQPSALSPVLHDYEDVGEEYGSLADGGSYERLRCRNCGRLAYSQLPD